MTFFDAIRIQRPYSWYEVRKQREFSSLRRYTLWLNDLGGAKLMHDEHHMSRKGWLLLAGLSFIWGSSFLLNEIALTALPPITVVTYRVVGAAITLFVILKASGMALPTGLRNWAILIVLSFFNNAAPFSLIVWGQTEISSGLASILNGTTPFFTIILASLVVAEKLTVQRMLGIITGFFGVVVIFGGGLTGGDLEVGMGELAVLGASLSYGIAISFSKRFMRGGMKPLQVAFGQLAGASLIMIPLALIVDDAHTLPIPPIEVIGAIAGLAVVCGAIAYILYFRMLEETGPTNTSLVTLTIPVVAIMLGVVFLGEPLIANHIYGMMLIGAGMLVMNGRFRRKVIE